MSKKEFIRNLCDKINDDNEYLENALSVKSNTLKAYAYCKLAQKKIPKFDFLVAETYANEAINYANMGEKIINNGDVRKYYYDNDYENVEYDNKEIINSCEYILKITNIVKPIIYQTISTPNDYAKISTIFRKENQSRQLANYAIIKGLERFPNSTAIDYLLYLKIVTMKESNIDEVENAISLLLNTYPNSLLLDDALAETIYAYTVVFPDKDKAEHYFNKLISIVPQNNYYFLTQRGNAVDNAYNRLASYYCKECLNGWLTSYDNENMCLRSKELYEKILTQFSYPTRFKQFAQSNLREINDHLSKKK